MSRRFFCLCMGVGTIIGCTPVPYISPIIVHPSNINPLGLSREDFYN